jgi:hypothetical protein
MNWLLGKEKKYGTYTIDGYTYSVEKIDPDGDKEVAYTLAKLNDTVMRILTELGRFIYAADHGELRAADNDVPLDQLRIMYERLRTRYNAEMMFESLGEYDNTSYVINQGEEIHMCVRGENLTVVLTVLIHELAHVASESYEHTDEFWDNYAILQKMVSKFGIVDEDDIPTGPATHCNKIKIERGEMMSLAKRRYAGAEPIEKGKTLESSPSEDRLFEPSNTMSGFVSIDYSGKDPGYVPSYVPEFHPPNMPNTYSGYCPCESGFVSKPLYEGIPVANVSRYYINPMLNPVGLLDRGRRVSPYFAHPGAKYMTPYLTPPTNIIPHPPDDLSFEDRLVYTASLPKQVPGTYTPQPTFRQAGHRSSFRRGISPVTVGYDSHLNHVVPTYGTSSKELR